ncbi:MAG: lipocalin-like domain-containing protein [Muribaculaceae bacterium]|nr:lipocalin-like domain-containing protein [Muribaculaceae bacterium]
MKYLKYFTVIFIALLLCSCTRNDGDIGSLFGQWKLESMTTDSKEKTDYKGNIFWSFQNTTVEMKEVIEPGEVYQTFGNFKVMDNTMFLSFPDADFPPRPVLGLPRDCEMQIIKISGGELILSYGDPATIFTFRKW